jgi:tetratricopeptide (TPR) repeat protein
VRRATVLLLAMVLCAAPLSGADGWGDYYKRGLAAVSARDWPAVKSSMESAIALKPVAQKPARWKNETMTYVPHYYLGVALFELGDVDGALEAFRVSESQGVIQRDALWADQRRWEARAQQQKGRSAVEAASDVRKTAETAINNATMAKAGAIGAGADRSDDFQKGSRLLTDAVAEFDKSGIDQDAYRSVAKKADEARVLFETAQKATRPAPRPTTRTPVDPAKAAEDARIAQQLNDLRAEIRTRIADLNGRLNDAQQTHKDDAEFQTFVLNNRSRAEQWLAMIPTVNDPAELQRISQNVTTSIEDLAQQAAALRAAAAAKAVPPPAVEPDAPRSAEAVSKTNADLKRAWGAFVKGDVDECEKISNEIVERRVGSADAYMLRGIAAYSRAMTLEREDLLDRAAADFAAAVRLNPSAKMDRRWFSPKLIAFFDQIKGSIRK